MLIKIDTKFTTLTDAVHLTEENAGGIQLSAKDTGEAARYGARMLTTLMGLFDEDCGQPTSELLSEAAFCASQLLELEEAMQRLAERAEQARKPSQETLEAAAQRIIRNSTPDPDRDPETMRYLDEVASRIVRRSFANQD